MTGDFDCERLTASAAQFLLDGGDESAAKVLLACTLDVWYDGDGWYDQASQRRYEWVVVALAGPRAAYDVLSRDSDEVTKQVHRAIEAVLPTDVVARPIVPRAELVDISTEWRSELLDIAQGKRVRNQGLPFGNHQPPVTWQNLQFRSVSERKIAEALDRADVLFLPNCVARLGDYPDRKNREPDFLVCRNHKWGILEVDGEPFHPPSRTTEDHERDRLFKACGVKVVEHYDARRCYENPDGVVNEFLELVDRNG